MQSSNGNNGGRFAGSVRSDGDQVIRKSKRRPSADSGFFVQNTNGRSHDARISPFAAAEAASYQVTCSSAGRYCSLTLDAERRRIRIAYWGATVPHERRTCAFYERGRESV